ALNATNEGVLSQEIGQEFKKGLVTRKRRLLLLLQGTTQPGPGIGPLTISLGPRYRQGVGRFFDGEARVEPQFDELGRRLIFGGQPVQDFVEDKHILRTSCRSRPIAQADATAPTASFLPVLAPGAFDQDAPHRFGRGGKEVAEAVPVLRSLDVYQPQVG